MTQADLQGKAMATETTAEALHKIDLECGALHLSVGEIQQKLGAVREYIVAVRQDKRDIAYLLQGELARFNETLEEELRDFRVRTSQQLISETTKFCEQQSCLPTAYLVADLNRFLADMMLYVFEKWQTVKEREANDWLKQTLQRFEDKNNKLVENVQQLAASLLEMQIPQVPKAVKLPAESTIYFLTEIPEPMFSYAGNWLVKLLPPALACKLLLKHRREQIVELVDMNCGRIRSDLYSRVAKSLDGFRRDFETRLDKNIEDLLVTLDAAAGQKEMRSNTPVHKD